MRQEIFNLTNFIMSHQFVQNKLIQEFVTISLLIKKILSFVRLEILQIKVKRKVGA